MKRTALTILFATLVTLGCSDGLSPGNGPGFSSLGENLTAEELQEIFSTLDLPSPDESNLDENDSASEDCLLGGSLSVTKSDSSNDDVEIFRYQYSSCKTNMMNGEDILTVTLNGHAIVTFDEPNLILSSEGKVSVSGDLGMLAECFFENINPFQENSSTTVTCTYTDSEGQTLSYEQSTP